MAALGEIGIDAGVAERAVVAAQLAFSGLNVTGGTISGTTTVAGVAGRLRVHLIRVGGAVVGTYYSAADGAFSFPNVAPGSYEILVYGEGVHRSRVFGPIEVP